MPTSEAKLNGYTTLQYIIYDTGANISVLHDACTDMSLDYRTEKDKISVLLVEFYERSGIVYHREGIIGDYDDFDDVEKLIGFIKTGKK